MDREGANNSSALLRRVGAGSLSGGFAAAVANPLDLVKTRLQAGGRLAVDAVRAGSAGAGSSAAAAAAEGAAPGGALAVLRGIVRTQGVGGLWRGTGPSIVRSATLTAAQCATYDEAKRFITSHTGWDDSFRTQFWAAMATGAEHPPARPLRPRQLQHRSHCGATEPIAADQGW